MRYLHILGRWDRGGIGRLVKNLVALNETSPTTHEVLVASTESGAALPADIDEIRGGVRTLSGSRLRRTIEFRRLAQTYDGFLVHTAIPEIVLYLLATRRPALLFQHGMPGSKPPALRRLLKGFFFNTAGRSFNGWTVCAGEYSVQKLLKRGSQIPKDKLVVVPFGTRLTRTTTPPRPRVAVDEIVVGVAARMIRPKRLDLPLRSLTSYRGRRPVTLLIAGDGPEEPSLRTLAAQIEDPVRVIFLGHVEDMTSFYDRLDLLLFPSRNESFGLVVLEAFDRGVPVAVFRDVGGCFDVVEHEVNGFVLDDGLPGLSSLWNRLDRHPTALRALSTRIIATDLSRFDISHTRRKLDDLLQNLAP